MSQEPCILLKDLVGPTELLWLRRNVFLFALVVGSGAVFTGFFFFGCCCFYLLFSLLSLLFLVGGRPILSLA